MTVFRKVKIGHGEDNGGMISGGRRSNRGYAAQLWQASFCGLLHRMLFPDGESYKDRGESAERDYALDR